MDALKTYTGHQESIENGVEVVEDQGQEVEVSCELCEFSTNIVTWCYDCQNILCISCDRSHNKLCPSHQKILLNELSNKIKANTKATQDQCKQLVEESRDMVTDINMKKDDVNEKRQLAIDEIEESRKDMISHVNAYHDYLIQSIKDKIDKYENDLSEDESKINNVCQALTRTSDKLENLSLSKNLKFIIKDGQNIVETLAKAIQTIKAELLSLQSVRDKECNIAIHKSMKVHLDDLINVEITVSSNNQQKKALPEFNEKCNTFGIIEEVEISHSNKDICAGNGSYDVSCDMSLEDDSCEKRCDGAFGASTVVSSDTTCNMAFNIQCELSVYKSNLNGKTETLKNPETVSDHNESLPFQRFDIRLNQAVPIPKIKMVSQCETEADGVNQVKNWTDYITGKELRVVDMKRIDGKDAHRLQLVNNLMYLTTSSRVYVYNQDGIAIKVIKYQHCNNPEVTSCLPLDENGFTIVDENHGIFHIDSNGILLTKLSSGNFCHMHAFKNRTYVLDYKKGIVHDFIKIKSSLTKASVINLRGFNKGDRWDRICVNDKYVLISSFQNNCLYVYTHAGQQVRSLGYCGRQISATFGGFLCGPLLCDVDARGSMLIAEFWNNRLQICHTGNEWLVVPLPNDLEHPMDVVVNRLDNSIWVLSKKVADQTNEIFFSKLNYTASQNGDL